MDDPSQSAAGAAARQDAAAQEKFRAQLQEGALTGLVERNTKWDVEYEGKDAKGTLVRPFEPGHGDARRLPEKMLGETIAQAVARSMGRDLPHSGAGDGKKVFKTEDNPARLKAMLKEEQDKDAPPPLPRKKENIKKQAIQQSRLEYQWSLGLTGGSFGMHTRHVTTAPPAHPSEEAAKEPPMAPTLGWVPESGPPSIAVLDAQYALGGEGDVNTHFVRRIRSNDIKEALVPPRARDRKKVIKDSSVMQGGEYNNSTTYSRASPTKHTLTLSAAEFLAEDNLPRTRDKPLRNEGAHAMLDRMGPNILSGPIPRDGFTTDAYENATREELHRLGFSDILGETGARPDEIEKGIDHLDKLETLGISPARDRLPPSVPTLCLCLCVCLCLAPSL